MFSFSDIFNRGTYMTVMHTESGIPTNYSSIRQNPDQDKTTSSPALGSGGPQAVEGSAGPTLPSPRASTLAKFDATRRRFSDQNQDVAQAGLRKIIEGGLDQK